MTSKIITGNKRAEDILREYFQREANPLPPVNPASITGGGSPQPLNPSTPITQAVIQPQKGLEFYQIDKQRIEQATTPTYRAFLKEAGWGDLVACTYLGIGKGVLKIDQTVRDALARANVSFTGNDGDYLVNINQPNARNVIHELGGKILPVALMYKVFIPYLLELKNQGDGDAQATLNEMTDTKAEWLEDIILTGNLGGKKVKIGTKERKVSLAKDKGYFNRIDLEEFGYPVVTKRDAGEHYYYAPTVRENAAIRNWDVGLGLNLDGVPSSTVDGLGVRRAKIFK